MWSQNVKVQSQSSSNKCAVTSEQTDKQILFGTYMGATESLNMREYRKRRTWKVTDQNRCAEKCINAWRLFGLAFSSPTIWFAIFWWCQFSAIDIWSRWIDVKSHVPALKVKSQDQKGHLGLWCHALWRVWYSPLHQCPVVGCTPLYIVRAIRETALASVRL